MNTRAPLFRFTPRRMYVGLAAAALAWASQTLVDIAALSGAGLSGPAAFLLARLPGLMLLAITLTLASSIPYAKGRIMRFAAAQSALFAALLAIVSPVSASAGRWIPPAVFDQLLGLGGVSAAYLLGFFIAFGLNIHHEYSVECARSEELRSSWAKASRASLRDELNPHFLFNTLNALVGLVHDDPHLTERLLLEFSELLRISLEKGRKDFNTLREEMQFIERYLAVMKIRHGDLLDASVHLEGDVTDYSVPSLLLMPLVENAVKHGVGRLGQPARIDIQAKRDDDTLHLTVKNSYRRPRSSGDRPAGIGIGLRNTRQRLVNLYGQGHSLRSGQDDLGSWLSVVTLPAIRHDMQAEASP